MADEKKIPGPGETPAPESHEPETPGPLPMGRVLFRALPIPPRPMIRGLTSRKSWRALAAVTGPP